MKMKRLLCNVWKDGDVVYIGRGEEIYASSTGIIIFPDGITQVPKPSEGFLKRYEESSSITKVFISLMFYRGEWKVYITPDNTVSIVPVEQAKFNIEEIQDILYEFKEFITDHEGTEISEELILSFMESVLYKPTKNKK